MLNHQPIAGELRIMTVGGSERFDHLVEELIENVQQVIGQFGLAQDRGTAQIDEHHRDQPLAPLEPCADHTVRMYARFPALSVCSSSLFCRADGRLHKLLKSSVSTTKILTNKNIRVRRAFSR